MLPVLTARESLTAVTRHALGSGLVPEGTQRQISATWNAAAQLAPKVASKPSIADLAGIGVAVRVQGPSGG